MEDEFGNPNAYDFTEASNYQNFEVKTDHGYDPGVLVLPVASESSMTVSVRQHAGYGYRTIKFNARKQGNPPVIPMPKAEINGRDLLTGMSLVISNPLPNLANGNYDWDISGQYTYVTQGPSRVPGDAEYPSVGFPYPLPIQDARAAQSGQSSAEIIQEIDSNELLLNGGWTWPLVSYPSVLFMNPNLIQG